MIRTTLVLFGLLLATSPTSAQVPRPVRPTVEIAYAHTGAQVRIIQDTCFVWSTPLVTREGTTFTITQDVAPRSNCTNGEAGSRNFQLEQVPAGSYRLVYRALAIGMPPIPSYSQEFSVQQIAASGRTIVVFPGQPTALEPLHAQFSLTSGCEFVDGVRPVEGGFAIVIHAQYSFACDADATINLALGSFTPGTYSLVMRRRAEEGGAEMARTQFTVSPTTQGVVSEPWADLSGVWTAADEDPATAFAFIHTLDRAPNGLLRDALVGTWYTYDETGAPAWYWIEASTDGASFNTRMAGVIFRYRSTNPGAPSFQRVAARDSVGTIQIRIFREGNPGSVSGTLNGRTFDIRLERFRWTRSAWPPPRNSPP